MRRKINLQYYKREIGEIKAKAREWGLSEGEINFAFDESLLYLRDKYPNLCRSRPIRRLKPRFFKLQNLIYSLLIVFLGLIILGLNYHKPVHNFVERNIQEVIYPFMKLYRRLTLPLVLNYPSLSELYDESCLLENPYFQVSNMDCWPCENIKFVLNLTDSKQNNAHMGLPYIIKTNESTVTFTDIKKIYSMNSEIFKVNSDKIQSSNSWSTASELFTKDWSNQEDLHVTWRINRMEPARILRYVLGLPKNVPDYEASILIERYLLYDGPKSSSYSIPATEGANVFLKQLSGSRLIVLEPTKECLHTCQRLSVFLQEQHILWYNWWYWRPRSLPAMNNTGESLALLGSAV